MSEINNQPGATILDDDEFGYFPNYIVKNNTTCTDISKLLNRETYLFFNINSCMNIFSQNLDTNNCMVLLLAPTPVIIYGFSMNILNKYIV